MYKLERKLHAISALLFVCILVLGVFVACACTNGFKTINPYGWFDKKTEAAQGEDNNGDLEIEEVVTSSYIRLLAGAEATTASDVGIAKTLTAIVEPANAPNKQVDWDLYWAEDADLGDQPIGDYLTLTPASDGATTATLRCIQSFRGSVAYVKVTTRVGGYEAICRVSFIGVPETLSLDTTGLTACTGYDSFMYEIAINGATLAINLDNVFHDVGNDAYNDITITLEGLGKIYVQNWNSVQGWTDSESEVTLESLKSEFVTVSLSGHNLVISPIKTVENYYESYQSYNTGAAYTNKFKGYVSGSTGAPQVTPHFKVSVRYGMSNTVVYILNFKIVSTVTGVSLSGDVTY
jgi:hypothetical protein